MTKKKSQKKSKNKKNLNKHLHPYVSWCVLGMVASCSLLLTGNATAALAQAGYNQSRMIERQQSVPFTRRFASSTSPMIRRPTHTCDAAASGTVCSLNITRLPENPQYVQGNRSMIINNQQFGMMQKNSGQLGKLIIGIKAQIALLQKQNITLPADLNQALTTLSNDIAQIKTASSSDNIQGMSGELSSSLQTIQNWTPHFSQLAQMPKLLVQAQTIINQASKYYTADQKKAAGSKFDLSAQLADYKSLIDQMQLAIDQGKTNLQTNPEIATTSLQTDFFNKQVPLQLKKIALDIALTPKQGLQEANQLISQDQRQIKSMKGKGIDTTQQDSLLSQAKDQASQVKNLLAAASTDSATVISSIQNLITTLLNLDGILPTPSAFSSTASKPDANFQIPDGFNLNQNQSQPIGQSLPPTPPPAETPSSPAPQVVQ